MPPERVCHHDILVMSSAESFPDAKDPTRNLRSCAPASRASSTCSAKVEEEPAWDVPASSFARRDQGEHAARARFKAMIAKTGYWYSRAVRAGFMSRGKGPRSASAPKLLWKARVQHRTIMAQTAQVNTKPAIATKGAADRYTSRPPPPRRCRRAPLMPNWRSQGLPLASNMSHEMRPRRCNDAPPKTCPIRMATPDFEHVSRNGTPAHIKAPSPKTCEMSTPMR